MAVDLPKLLLVLAGSLTVLLQTLIQEKERWDFYWILAVVVSGLSCLACVPALLVTVCVAPGPEGRSREAPAVFLAGLWTLGALPLTLERPFSLAGNGYFGTWAALACSWLMALANHPQLAGRVRELASGGGPALAVLLLASLTAFLQTSWSCGTRSGWCNGNAAWVLVCSAISTCLCITLFMRGVAERLQQHFKLIALFFLVWWAAGAVATTFERPYENSYANGYFSCWAAVAASAQLVASSWQLSVSDAALATASEVSGGAPPEVLVLLLASAVALAAGAVDCAESGCGGLVRWAVVCSAVSLAACFALVVYTIRGGWVTEGAAVRRFAYVMCAWWAVGATSMTFGGPFQHLGNGYFAAWVAFVSAYMFAIKNIDSIRLRLTEISTRGKELAAVFIASVVLLTQAAWDCAGGNCDGRVWALCCSIISLCMCIAIAWLLPRIQDRLRLIALGLLLWWSVGVGTLTFHKPYVRTCNGYFACWCAWCGSGWWLIQQFPQLAGYGNMDDPGSAKTLEEKPPAVLDAEELPSGALEDGAAPTVVGSPFSDNAM